MKNLWEVRKSCVRTSGLDQGENVVWLILFYGHVQRALPDTRPFSQSQTFLITRVAKRVNLFFSICSWSSMTGQCFGKVDTVVPLVVFVMTSFGNPFLDRAILQKSTEPIDIVGPDCLTELVHCRRRHFAIEEEEEWKTLTKVRGYSQAFGFR